MVNHNPEEFYKNIAHRYHWFFSSWENVMNRQMEQLVPLLRKHKIRSVLDCACGTGLQLIGLAESGFDVVGSDLSENMLAVARRNLEKEGIGDVQLIQADFREINKKIDRKFDAVICMGNSIPHLLEEDEILKALRSIHDCLDNEGISVIETRNYD
ncbi:MAG: class I SAM-dependent methyltransferase, partial [Limnochordia bacterium]